MTVKNNNHECIYDFDKLCEILPELKPFVFTNKYENKSIDFSNPQAVKTLNKALLFFNHKIKYWDFPNKNLCPAIPGRTTYINILKTLLETTQQKNNFHILDIGTGASCIYPLIGNDLYQWYFTGTDIDEKSIQNAQKIINNNDLENKIKLRFQSSSYHIFKNIITVKDKYTATMCNPPFFESQEQADKENLRKQKGLGIDSNTRNFSGNSNELWVKGGEIAFLKKYINESFLFKNQCLWYTILISKKENIRKAKVALKKLNAFEVKSIPFKKGNKITRVVAWTFLNKEEQNNWNH